MLIVALLIVGDVIEGDAIDEPVIVPPVIVGVPITGDVRVLFVSVSVVALPISVSVAFGSVQIPAAAAGTDNVVVPLLEPENWTVPRQSLTSVPTLLFQQTTSPEMVVPG